MINPRGISLIKEFEGFEGDAYQDEKGIWTLGYGFTENVKPGDTMSEPVAAMHLIELCSQIEDEMRSLIKVRCSDNEWSALISFTYNEGVGRLASSTLLTLLNHSLFRRAADELPKWHKMSGACDEGLLRRRIAERELFLLS